MTILSLNVYPSSESWAFQANTLAFESPFDRTVQTSSLSGGKWRARLVFSNLTRQKMNILRSFFMQLEGQAGRFYLTPNLSEPLGDAILSDDGFVNGAGQSGSTLVTDGWTAATNLFQAGDFFEVNGELKVVTADCTSDGSGNATINFKPAMRSIPADNQQIIVSNPRCVMKLLDDDQSEWQLSIDTTYGVSITCEEAI